MKRLSGASAKNPRLFHLVSRTVIVSTVFVVLLAVVLQVYVTARFVLVENGNARVSILEEISEISKSNRSTMKGIMLLVQQALEPALTGTAEPELITQQLSGVQEAIDRVGIDANVDVILNAKTVYRTGHESEESIRTLLNSYWYIKHYSGMVSDSWNIRLTQAGSRHTYYLSYGRSVFQIDGTVAGVLVVNMSLQNPVEAMDKLASSSDQYYILDENGVVVCHSNIQRIGNWMVNINDFRSKYGFNTSKYITSQNQIYMLSNYHDAESGWTFVDQQNLSGLIRSIVGTWLLYVLIACGVGAAVICFSAARIRRALRPLSVLTQEIYSMNAEQLRVLLVPEGCYEIQVLGTVFNRMIEKILDLIQDIRYREAEKRQLEYDFLQTQLSPHFIYNTLLSIKSLMLMQQTDKAGDMLDGFMDIIHIPKGPDIPFVSLRDELHLIDLYIHIMNGRMDKAVRFIKNVPDELLEIPVPRMVLQPVVENCFFYGFAEMEDDLFVRVSACRRDSVLDIQVVDNGEGIDPDRLAAVQGFEYAPDPIHHGVGLKNIRQRLKIIYDETSEVRIDSAPGRGVCVTLHIEGYRRQSTELPSDLATGKVFGR